MNNKVEILKKVLLIALWMGVASVSVVLLVAAKQKNSDGICKDVVVSIKSSGQGGYIGEKEILNRISGNRPDLLKESKLTSLSLSQLESLLEQHLWIRNAEIYLDTKNRLHIDVEERVPVARVFSIGGESFYIDDSGKHLPVNGNQIALVPVFTGFPQITYPLAKKDSLLATQICNVGKYIMKNEFWKAQIDQIHIEQYEMEFVPKLGKHQILFGEGVMVEQKFKRLMLFYQQIMKKAGWNYYSSIDLRYNKQLVAVRRDSVSLYQSFIIPSDTLAVKNTLDSAALENDTTVQLLINQF
jgi:cell division protein FtsQ